MMALRVQRSAALLVAAIVLCGCEPGSPFGSSVSTGSPGVSQTGTATVRGRIQQLRSDQNALAAGIATQQGQLTSTRGQMQNDSQAYDALIRAISSRLQTGTTPGNPDLVTQWNEAQAKLDAVTLGVGQLNSLASQVTTQASVAVTWSTTCAPPTPSAAPRTTTIARCAASRQTPAARSRTSTA
jgi:hypothetical protein